MIDGRLLVARGTILCTVRFGFFIFFKRVTLARREYVCCTVLVARRWRMASEAKIIFLLCSMLKSLMFKSLMPDAPTVAAVLAIVAPKNCVMMRNSLLGYWLSILSLFFLSKSLGVSFEVGTRKSPIRQPYYFDPSSSTADGGCQAREVRRDPPP